MCQALFARKGLREQQQWGSVVPGSGGSRRFVVSAPCNTYHPVWRNPLMQCERQRLAPFDPLPYTRAQVLGFACFVTGYSLHCIQFSACGDTIIWPLPVMSLYKKRRKCSVRLNLVLTHTWPLASNHMGVSPSASLVILMLAGTRAGCWEEEQTFLWFLRVKKLFLFLKQAVEVWDTSSFPLF